MRGGAAFVCKDEDEDADEESDNDDSVHSDGKTLILALGLYRTQGLETGVVTCLCGPVTYLCSKQ